MKIQTIKKGALEYIIIDNLYSEKELNIIYDDLEKLITYAADPNSTGTATNENGKLLKKGKGVFVDDVYVSNRNDSKLLKIIRKIFDDKIIKAAEDFNAFFRHIRCSTSDRTLLNFYSSNEGYKSHNDLNPITVITMLQLGEFTGGNFIFTDYDEIINYQEGRVIIFPGCVNHEAQIVKCKKNNYRVSIAQFLTYRN